MYALVEYKGKQYKAEKDALIQVDKIDAEKGATIEIDTVLLVSNDGSVSVGAPYVKGAKVKAIVEDSIRDKKVIVYKYKSKKFIIVLLIIFFIVFEPVRPVVLIHPVLTIFF